MDLATFERVLLPQSGESFLTEAGLETDFIFNHGIDIPHFCTAVLLDDPANRSRLKQYYREFVALAQQYKCGVVLETPTWRMNRDWAERLGYNAADRRRLNIAAVHLLQDLRQETNLTSGRFIVSGNLGPRADGYKVAQVMTIDESAEYHREQVETLRDAGADCICAMTITTAEEATGIAKTAQSAEMPAVISFTVETDGSLPSGMKLNEAIAYVDQEAPDAVSYFGINCAHPTHFDSQLDTQDSWTARIGTIRANASTMSHAELDNSTVLDAGDPQDFGDRYLQLRNRLPELRVFGGCCGTDIAHIVSICERCLK
ncbi:Homocysteine S-methyltransferase [Polystyrenella longa]|uniref:Homocysteine S-methyltransferase n=1 Tax=Polystyrenella longa TaxID=2528007 RepID=A0A518CGV3_9PLAN|nr:homocysteine S-methyltransferase family protein [Polystyrenella longa]QDU78458.1 Homocysteine S-methyltransferase [Polystyrenella longa]